MNDLNEVLMEGRLVRDPNARRLESGALVCTFPIASNTYYVDKKKGTQVEVPTFMLVETWQNVADACSKYLGKGDCVRVAGRIRQSKWVTENNVQMARTFISAEHVEFRYKAKPVEEQESIPTQVKSTDEEPDVSEQKEIEKEIEKEIINEKEDE